MEDEIRSLMRRHIVFLNGYCSRQANPTQDYVNAISSNVKIVSYIDDIPCTAFSLHGVEGLFIEKNVRFWQRLRLP